MSSRDDQSKPNYSSQTKLESAAHSIPGGQPQERTARGGSLRLSHGQQRLWFIDQMAPGDPVHHIPVVHRLNGHLDVEVLQRSLVQLALRHDALRTAFPSSDGQPVQVIARDSNALLQVVELRGHAAAGLDAEVMRLATEEFRRPFDLARGPLWRATLFQLGEQDSLLLVTMHHLIADGRSTEVFIRDLSEIYGYISSGAEIGVSTLPHQYLDVLAWQRQRLEAGDLDDQLAYWKQRLGGQLPLLELPGDRTRPPVQSRKGANQRLDLPYQLTSALDELARKQGVTLFTTLLTAFQVLLQRYTGQDDILVGSPAPNGGQTKTEGLIGFFDNPLVLRSDLSGNPTFVELLARVREVTLGAYSHQDLPFEKLIEELLPERDLGHNPLFQVRFDFQDGPATPLLLDGVTSTPVELELGTAAYDLTLMLRNGPDGLSGRFEYNTDLFDADTMSRMVGSFRTLLEGIVADPARHTGELPLLPDAEWNRLLVTWNQTQASYPEDSCVHDLFEAQVQRAPDAVAAVFGDQQLTYRQLNSKANQLARHLRSLGVGPEVLVGVCVERSLDIVLGFLGVLKAGGAYVPLDPAYPRERLAFMLDDFQASVLLTQESLLGSIPEHQARVVCLDTEWDTISQRPEGDPGSIISPDDLAYVIYTSGSTGLPKGTLLQHRGLCNVSANQIREFGVGPGSRVLQLSSLSYDSSIFEIVMGLCSGAALYLGTREALLPGVALAKFLTDNAITIITCTPSALAAMPDGDYPDLKTITVAGEACPPELLEAWPVGRRFFNLYGPTEATIWSTFTECFPGMGKPPIGRPISNVQTYVLDPHLQPVPVGVPGELHIAGFSLAKSYRNRPELSAEKFIPNPFSDDPGARLYKAGDLVRYLPDGNIEFLGRIDDQVKIRGFRIEPGEIEAVLAQHPSVREASVIVREDTPGEKRLTAYVVSNHQPPPTASSLRRYLQEKLPDYLVPSALVTLDALPLTTNGKLDRRALPAPEIVRPDLEADYVAPRTAAEQTVAAVWQEVLQMPRVGLHDNFFDLGGHSLLLTRVHSKLREIFDRDISVIYMFKYPTVSALAGHLSEDATATVAAPTTDDFAEKRIEGRARLQLLQQRRQRGR